MNLYLISLFLFSLISSSSLLPAGTNETNPEENHLTILMNYLDKVDASNDPNRRTGLTFQNVPTEVLTPGGLLNQSLIRGLEEKLENIGNHEVKDQDKRKMERKLFLAKQLMVDLWAKQHAEKQAEKKKEHSGKHESSWTKEKGGRWKPSAETETELNKHAHGKNKYVHVADRKDERKHVAYQKGDHHNKGRDHDKPKDMATHQEQSMPVHHGKRDH